MRLIHMNGRIYDPRIGRFMTADPVIDGVFSTQGMNRYSYVHNNPLAYTDPDGLFLRGLRGFFKKNPVAGLVVGLATAWATGGLTFAPFTMSLEGAIVAGGVSGLLSDGLKGAALGALSGAVTFGIGDLQLGLTGFADVAAKAVLHGVAQGTFAEMQGGKFGAAFLAAAVSKVGGYGLEKAFPGTGIEAVVAKGVGVAVIGGTVSVIGGGKFANGAATAAFVYAFNQLASQGGAGYSTNDAGYHWYEVESRICMTSMAGCTPENVYSSTRRYFAPGQEGQNMVENLQVSGLGIAGHVQTILDSQHLTVTNWTMPDHILRDGFVQHGVIVRGEAVWLRTVGEGVNTSAFMARINNHIGRASFSTVHDQIRFDVHKRYIGPAMSGQ